MTIEYLKPAIIILIHRNWFHYLFKNERKKRLNFTLKTALKNHSGHLKCFRFSLFLKAVFAYQNLIHFRRDQLLKKIAEQEATGKTLKDKQKGVATVQVDGKKQMRLWKDLLRQMELKQKNNSVKWLMQNFPNFKT